MSFNGGTDATPALKRALEMLKDDDYKNADVMVISDFVMPPLDEKLVAEIEGEKKKHTQFYSLVIGTSENQKAIECFNHNWSYVTGDIHATRHLVEHTTLF